MTQTVKPLIAGNWKMNGLSASRAELDALARGVAEATAGRVDMAVCPPATLVATAADALRGSGIATGGQDCHTAASGAHTGDISAEMLADAGANMVIVGHSERRADHGEDDACVRAKAEAAWRAGLVAILCVGETEAERKAGTALEVVGKQLAGSVPDRADAERLIVAYEPVWAIGTGLTPTAEDVAEMHASLRAGLVERFGAAGEGIRLLYGGSVKPGNAEELMSVANVNGALVGGASLKAADFLAIAAATAAVTQKA
ncbi:triose-phosphate isomerase [Stappia taiwanensis]|uniref:Triosephosphate isomerase n=1 Tax=Stappia taiwanensis TaxID=992267 RepID=A0A838XG07_9HYPH|nr:triose-phosphate isomerase [Stappia taiwanensis]MBA4610339.1 triose-phosphate isomerase [Stappia taiwanensis]